MTFASDFDIILAFALLAMFCISLGDNNLLVSEAKMIADHVTRLNVELKDMSKCEMIARLKEYKERPPLFARCEDSSLPVDLVDSARSERNQTPFYYLDQTVVATERRKEISKRLLDRDVPGEFTDARKKEIFVAVVNAILKALS